MFSLAKKISARSTCISTNAIRPDARRPNNKTKVSNGTYVLGGFAQLLPYTLRRTLVFCPFCVQADFSMNLGIGSSLPKYMKNRLWQARELNLETKTAVDPPFAVHGIIFQCLQHLVQSELARRYP